MTEKEFLIKFIKTFAPNPEEHPSGQDTYINEYADNFLEYHHKEYFEVEFVKKTPEEILDMRKFQERYAEKPTVHELYDGTTAVFDECWEDNEGFVHHIDSCKLGTCKLQP